MTHPIAVLTHEVSTSMKLLRKALRIFKFGDRIVGMRDGRIESVVSGEKAGSSLLKQ